MKEARHALPAAAGWVATAVLVGFPDAVPVALVVGWIVTGVLALVRPRLALVAVAIALCLTSIALHSPSRSPDYLLRAASAHHEVSAQAVADEPSSGSFRATLTSAGGRLMAVPVLVFGEPPSHRIPVGSTVELSGRLVRAEAGDDRAFLMFTDSPPTLLAEPPWYLGWANDLRSRFLRAAASLPEPGGGLLAGLAIGDTSAVPETLDAAMKTSSLSHLTAVSGANCAIVIGLVMLAGGALGLPRGLKIGASAVVLVGFVVLVTPQPSVMRAAVMALLVLIALARGRPAGGMPVLALATIVLLVVDPWLARDYGFALSVLATGGLLMLAGPLADALGRWLPRWLALVLAVPLAAQLACQPVLILLDASLPTYGVVANLLAAPAAPVATVVGLAACIAVSVAPPIGTLLTAIAWLPSSWIAAVAQFFANAPLARLPWPEGAPGVALLVLVSTVAVVALVRRSRWAVVGCAVLLVICGAVGCGIRVVQLLGRPPDWQVAMCDVGQGDAAVVRSLGQVALIDAGPDPAPLRACLDDLGIAHIDLLVLTHFDLDHVGGVDAVVGRSTTAFVGPSAGAADDRIVEQLAAAGTYVQRVSRGQSGMLGELRWEVIWPPSRPEGLEPGNESSVTVVFTPAGQCAAGCLSSMFLGDLGEDAQRRVIAGYHGGVIDVVKVAHHGSSDQSEELYQRVSATIGIIGVGADNDYGHPTDRLLQILARAGTAVERTDSDGLILLWPGSAPGTVSVWTAR